MLELISSIAGVLLSLAFSYIPGAKDWFAKLSGEYKRLVMLGSLLLASAAVMLLACTGWAADLGINITCDRPGLVQLLTAFLAAFVSNQATFQITPKSKSEGVEEDDTPVR